MCGSEVATGSGGVSSDTRFSLPVFQCEGWSSEHKGSEHFFHADDNGFLALRGFTALNPSDNIPAGAGG